MQTIDTTSVTITPDLDDYADEINRLYDQVKSNLTTIARMLIAAKEAHPGKYLAWLRSGAIAFSEDTAERIVNAHQTHQRVNGLEDLGYTIAARLNQLSDTGLENVVSLIQSGERITGDTVPALLYIDRQVARIALKHGVDNPETIGLMHRLPDEVRDSIEASGYVQSTDEGDAVAITADPAAIMKALVARRKTEVGILLDGQNGLNLRVIWIDGVGDVVAGFESTTQAENWIMGKRS